MSAQPANPRHRKSGHVGRFTVHAPEDYRPRHRAHECSKACDPGNCEIEHFFMCYPGGAT